MSPTIIISVVAGYFFLLILISLFTAKNATDTSFFDGDKQSPWYLVAFGMIGASLSGITFISIPGWIGASQFSYMQMVFGYILGYLVISFVLLPLYYRLNVTSIYAYLGQRFGLSAHRTGAFFFLISRILGASFRLFLVVDILQVFVFNSLGVPFWVTTLLSILLIWLYTFRSGIKTVVWTDTLQTFFMLLALGLCMYYLLNDLDFTFSEAWSRASDSNYTSIWITDPLAKNHWAKHLIGGMFITIAMTGLDQDMMQKNLTCRNLREAKTNVLSFTGVLVVVNFLFLFLGALLFLYSDLNEIPMPMKVVGGESVASSDRLLPTIALSHLPTFAGFTFLIGLIAAAYSSADSALTALTTSFCIDFLEIEKKPEKAAKRIRMHVHIGFSLVLLFVIVLVNAFNKGAMIGTLFNAANYTYGPLLGLFSFGLFTKRSLPPLGVILVSLLVPTLMYLLNTYSKHVVGNYQFGFELLPLNGLLTFGALYLTSIISEDQKPSFKAAQQ